MRDIGLVRDPVSKHKAEVTEESIPLLKKQLLRTGGHRETKFRGNRCLNRQEGQQVASLCLLHH